MNIEHGIKLGPVLSGRTSLPDGSVTITFLAPNVLEVSVDGGQNPLDFTSFTATVGVSTNDQELWDSAVGNAGTP